MIERSFSNFQVAHGSRKFQDYLWLMKDFIKPVEPSSQTFAPANDQPSLHREIATQRLLFEPATNQFSEDSLGFRNNSNRNSTSSELHRIAK